MTAASKSLVEQETSSITDPVTTEVIRRRLIAIADQVDINITRTAFSPYVYVYKDYAVGMVDADGRLLCQGSGAMPIFVADIMGAAVRDGLTIYGPTDMRHGDIIVTNYSGTVGQHLNNVVMYTPIRDHGDNSGDLIGFMVVVMHWLDVGGTPSPSCTDIYMEGIQLRTVKMYDQGVRNEELFRVVIANCRMPSEVLGDIAAQVAGCYLGRNEMIALVDRYGIDTYRSAVLRIWDQSESRARAAIAAVPDGVYSADAVLDGDGINEGIIPLSLSVIIAGSDMTIDLSRMPAEVSAPINSGRHGGGQTVARVAFRYLMIPGEDATEGSFRPLHLDLPEGTIVSASASAPMLTYNVPLPTLIDLVVKALAPAIPNQVSAGHYGTYSSLFFRGQRDNGDWYQMTDSGFGGWGALEGQDGPGPFRTMCHGDTKIIPVEVQEASYPLRVENFSIREDSGGAGQWRGANGLRKIYRTLRPMQMLTVFDRTVCPPWGLLGGKDGLPGRVSIRRDDDDIAVYKGLTPVGADELIFVETGGGGGFGDPALRSRDAIREDLVNEYTTPDFALSLYGFAQG